MIRALALGGALALAALIPTASQAKEYVDYTPGKGLWEVNAIEVDPNHIDDYLTGLRRSQFPGFDIMKRHGIIDDYRVLVRNGYNKGAPNVLIETHYVNAAMLEPDRARDQMIEREITATFSDEDGKVAVAGYEKYRQFIDDGFWTEMTIAH